MLYLVLHREPVSQIHQELNDLRMVLYDFTICTDLSFKNEREVVVELLVSNMECNDVISDGRFAEAGANFFNSE